MHVYLVIFLPHSTLSDLFRRLISDISMVMNNDKKGHDVFPVFMFFLGNVYPHTCESLVGHVTRVKQVSRTASGEGTRAGCCKMISLLRESRRREAARQHGVLAKPWQRNCIRKRKSIWIGVWPIRQTIFNRFKSIAIVINSRLNFREKKTKWCNVLYLY